MRLASPPCPTRAQSPLIAMLLLTLSGCAEGEHKWGEMPRRVGAMPEAPSSSPVARGVALAPMADKAGAPADQANPDQPNAAAPAEAATAGRKIIYEAHVDLVTEDLPRLEVGLRQLVGSNGAYVADSNRTGATGSSRSGTWKIRVPVNNFDALLRGVSGLGELVSTRSNSEDVSAEYYDLEARATAKKVEEARLLKHLSDSTGRLDEILAVERELSRVRSEIERMQGRLGVLANLTTLATVNVSASEVKNYVPPNPPTLSQRVGRTFSASVANLANFGEAILLFVVALAPWSPLILVGAVLALIVLRWAVRQIRAEGLAQAARLQAALAARITPTNPGA